jgi:DNA invertase Pin-like site-specific DNA recombinase
MREGGVYMRGRPPKSTAMSTKATAKMIWRIAVYLRLSREDGGEESGSVTNQKKILQEYLKNFFEGHYVVVDFYIDDGLSGTDDSRESFMRMIQDIEAGKVNCVVCKTLSRAFRNYSDQGYYLEYYFPQKNVRFVSTGDPKIDTFTNPEAITGLEVPITGLMNDRYAAKTSNDVRRTFDHKRRNGEFIGAFAPYGYLKDPENKNRLILDENVVPIKKEIYRWIVREGMSLGGAARRLNDMGIPSPGAYKRSIGLRYNNPVIDSSDGLWTGSAVRRILLDRVNLGHMLQGKQRVVSYKVHDRITVPQEDWFIKENTHDPTFTPEEFDTLARLLARETRTANGAQIVHLFSGFLRCGDCKKALQRKAAKDRVYYACRTYTEKSKDRCTKHSIREDRLYSMVFQAVQAQIALLNNLSGMMKEIDQTPAIGTQTQRLKKLLAEKYRELEKVRSVGDALYTDWKTGVMKEADYLRRNAKYAEQEAQAEAAIAGLKAELKSAAQAVTSENSVFELFLKHKNLRQLDRALLIELVDTIYVHKTKEITICFRYADEPERITK